MNDVPQISRDDAQQLAAEFIESNSSEAVSFLGGTHISDAARQSEIGIALGHGDYLLTFMTRKKVATESSMLGDLEEYVVRVNDQTGACSSFSTL